MWTNVSESKSIALKSQVKSTLWELQTVVFGWHVDCSKLSNVKEASRSRFNTPEIRNRSSPKMYFCILISQRFVRVLHTHTREINTIHWPAKAFDCVTLSIEFWIKLTIFCARKTHRSNCKKSNSWSFAHWNEIIVLAAPMNWSNNIGTLHISQHKLKQVLFSYKDVSSLSYRLSFTLSFLIRILCLLFSFTVMGMKRHRIVGY